MRQAIHCMAVMAGNLESVHENKHTVTSEEQVTNKSSCWEEKSLRERMRTKAKRENQSWEHSPLSVTDHTPRYPPNLWGSATDTWKSGSSS